MSRKKIRYQETTTLVDEHGNIKQEKHTNIIQFPNEPPFIIPPKEDPRLCRWDEF